MSETIFALSTGNPPAAIAVVRISGPGAVDALQRLAGTPPPPRRLSLRTLRDPGTGELLDHALVTHFPAVTSVTGEPLAELHLHGSRAVVDAVLTALARMPGLAPARAGQFTWRAFRNRRLNLIEVESLSHLLRAETEAQRRAALAGEGLSARVEDWRSRILILSAHVEAALDQSDEDDVPADRAVAQAMAEQLAREIGAVLARPAAERLFDGVRVVFAGPPNAGKSTLMNALAGREVAIVSPIAGTTRDVVEAPVLIDGIAFVLADTAGLREESSDPIETEGIARAKARIAAADIVVWMDDRAPPSDIVDDRFLEIFPRADIGRDTPATSRLHVSAALGKGIDALRASIIRRAKALIPQEGEVALVRRQRVHLAACHDAIDRFLNSQDDLIAAEHLRDCRRELDALTGRAGTDDLLDSLFGTFCIGK